MHCRECLASSRVGRLACGHDARPANDQPRAASQIGLLSKPEPTSAFDPLQTLESDAQIVAMSWLLSWLEMSPVLLAFLAYWWGLHTAARLLPKERLRHGDYRVVPDLYSPESSHRWFGIIVGEKTNNYSKRLKGALTLARVALVLLPFAALGSMALLGNVRTEPTDNAVNSMPVVTIPLDH